MSQLECPTLAEKTDARGGACARTPFLRRTAPRPVDDDLVPMFRRFTGGVPGDWTRLHPVRRRRLLGLAGARREHPMLDICRELAQVGLLRSDELDSCAPFLLLREAVRAIHGDDGAPLQIAIVAEQPRAATPGPKILWFSPLVRF